MAKNTVQTTGEVKAVPDAGTQTFTKEQLSASKRYAPLRDLVNVLLEDGGQYTLDEVDKKIEAFKKGKVR